MVGGYTVLYYALGLTLGFALHVVFVIILEWRAKRKDRAWYEEYSRIHPESKR